MKHVVWVIVVLVLALSAATEARRQRHHRRQEAQERLHEYRVVNQNLHLDMLEKEIEELEEELEDLSPFPEEHETDVLAARLDNLENDTCDYYEDGEVSCGGEVPQCISSLFVCDGHEDCDNGHDEDEDHCSDETYKVGSTITGVTEWHDCAAHDGHHTVITITANTKPKAYTSRVYVKAVVSFEIDEDEDVVQSFNAKGYWNAGRRALVLVPEGEETFMGSDLGIICRFIFGSNDEADCTILTVGSKKECAKFHGERP